tara:strand:+ start:209 stop:421 length:213 start_codon:yes stop_codon:yes gene_type:complete
MILNHLNKTTQDNVQDKQQDIKNLLRLKLNKKNLKIKILMPNLAKKRKKRKRRNSLSLRMMSRFNKYNKN